MASQSKRISLPWLLLTALVVATLATWGANRWVSRGGPLIIELPNDVYYDLVYLNDLAGLPPCPEASDSMLPRTYPSPRAQAYYRRLVERSKPYYEHGSETPYALWAQWVLSDRCYRGWPFISHREISRVGIEFRSANNEPRHDILFYANIDGFPPTEYACLAANFGVYFGAAVLLLLWGGASAGERVLGLCWREIVRLSILYQRLHRPIRLKWSVLAAMLFASVAAWWTHTFVHTKTWPSFCGDILCLNLNEAIGLPPGMPVCSSLDDIPQKPPQMQSFCSRICDQVEPFARQYHTKDRKLSVEVGLVGLSRGWPLTSFEVVATVELIDYSALPGQAKLLIWEVNAKGDPASTSTYGLIGNWFLLSVTTLVVSLVLGRAIFLLTYHIVQTQPSFPVVMLSGASDDSSSPQ